MQIRCLRSAWSAWIGIGRSLSLLILLLVAVPSPSLAGKAMERPHYLALSPSQIATTSGPKDFLYVATYRGIVVYERAANGTLTFFESVTEDRKEFTEDDRCDAGGFCLFHTTGLAATDGWVYGGGTGGVRIAAWQHLPTTGKLHLGHCKDVPGLHLVRAIRKVGAVPEILYGNLKFDSTTTSGGVTVWKREFSGAVTKISDTVAVGNQGQEQFAVSADGKYVYANPTGSIVAYTDTALDGHLTEFARLPVTGIPYSVDIYPRTGDPHHAYVAIDRPGNTGAVMVVQRDQAANALVVADEETSDVIPQLDNAVAVVASEGAVFVASSATSDTLVSIQRNADGTLGSLIDSEKDGAVDADSGLSVDGLNDPFDMVIDPTGKYLYLAAIEDNKVSVFEILAGGKLKFLQATNQETEFGPCTPSPTRTITPTRTLTPTKFTTPTMTHTPAVVHDSVVLPPNPVNLHIPKPAGFHRENMFVQVRNGDVPEVSPATGHNIKLMAAGDPPCIGLVESIKFSDGTNSIFVKGKSGAQGVEKATVSLKVTSAAFNTFNSKNPYRCRIRFTATTDGPGVDLTPWNNSVDVEVNVFDGADLDLTAVHQTVVDSISPLQLPPPPSKNVQIKIINADNPDPGSMGPHQVGVTMSAVPGFACPAGMVSAPTFTGGGASSTLPQGSFQNASVPVSPNLAAAPLSTATSSSPYRCAVDITATGPIGDQDSTNNTTRLTIDVPR